MSPSVSIADIDPIEDSQISHGLHLMPVYKIGRRPKRGRVPKQSFIINLGQKWKRLPQSKGSTINSSTYSSDGFLGTELEVPTKLKVVCGREIPSNKHSSSSRAGLELIAGPLPDTSMASEPLVEPLIELGPCSHSRKSTSKHTAQQLSNVVSPARVGGH
jgi:hypothetical protein